MSKTARTLAVAGFIIVSTLPAAAQTSQPPTDEHVKALIAQAMQQTAQQPPAAPAPPVDRAGRSDGESHRTGSVARARDKNLTLISERITPQTWDYTMAATRANYQINLTSSVSNNSQVRADDRRILGRQSSADGHAELVGGYRAEPVARRGQSTRSMDQQPSRQQTPGARPSTPASTSGLQARFIQPLLRNFKIDATRAQILTNEINQQIADINAERHEVSILAQVRNAYWELVYARQAVEAAEDSLRTGAEAGRRQPRARRDRHDGADRRRPGAGGGSEPTPAAGHRPGDAAQQRARTQAPDRRRHR